MKICDQDPDPSMDPSENELRIIERMIIPGDSWAALRPMLRAYHEELRGSSSRPPPRAWRESSQESSHARALGRPARQRPPEDIGKKRANEAEEHPASASGGV